MSRVNNKKKHISFFRSPSFYSIILTLILSINPAMENILTKGKVEAKDYWAIIMLLASASLQMIVRVSEKDTLLTTPKYLPGPNNDGE